MALRARAPRWFGVLGTPYQRWADGTRVRRAPTPDGPGELLLAFGDPQLATVLARQLAVVLHDVTQVDLDTELATAGQT